MRAVILDTETTGTGDDAEVVELAYKEFSFDAAPSKTTLRYFSHARPMNLGALATHHIIAQDLVGAPRYTSADAPSADFYIGHMIDFDHRVLGSPSVKTICTLAMARAVWPQADSHTQGALLYMLHGDHQYVRALLRSAHSAATDIDICEKILRAILSLNPHITSLEDLWHFSEDCRIPRVMTFGKFKGEPVSSVDNGWRAWYRKQSNTDPYLLQAFTLFPYVR